MLKGEEHGRSKIKNEDALQIFHSDLSCKELADKYGLNKGYIRRIKNGDNWSHLTGKDPNDQRKGRIGRPTLSEKEVFEIIELVKVYSKPEIAKIYGVTKMTIYNIFYGYSWQRITNFVPIKPRQGAKKHDKL